MNKIVLIGAMLLLISCSPKHKSDGVVLEIGNPIQLDNFSDIFSDVEFIHLDTTSNAIISRASRIEINNDSIYIHCSRANNIFTYDSKGNFIYNTKSARGRARNEFTVLSDYVINPITSNLEIYDPARRQILILDNSGKYKEKIELPEELFYNNKFEIFNENEYIFTGAERNLLTYNKFSDRTLTREMNESGFPKGTYSPHNVKSFFRCSDKFYFIPNYDKYIYSVNIVDQIELTTEYTLQLTDNPLKSADIVSKSKEELSEFINSGGILNYSSFHYRHITDKYIVLSYLHQGWHHYIYNRKSGKSICFDELFASENRLPPAQYVTNENYYALIDPLHIEQIFPNCDFIDSQQLQIDKDAQNSNFIIAKFNLKDRLLE